MLKEVDWVLNEAGDIATTESVRSTLGKHTRSVKEWTDEYNCVLPYLRFFK